MCNITVVTLCPPVKALPAVVLKKKKNQVRRPNVEGLYMGDTNHLIKENDILLVMHNRVLQSKTRQTKNLRFYFVITACTYTHATVCMPLYYTPTI